MKNQAFHPIMTAIFAVTICATFGNGCSKGFLTSDFRSDSSYLMSSDGSSVYAPIAQPELKPLTPREYGKAMQVMLGLNANSGKSTLPQISAAPFDNNAAETVIGKVHIDSFEYTAGQIADAFLASSTRATYIPCVAQSATDRTCLEKFAVQLASSAFRDLVTAAQVKDIVDLALASATELKQFDAGLKLVIQTVLQDPRFLYRFEVGTLKNADYELTDLEYLSKVTFFILGAPPTLKQIQEVRSGAFATPELKEAYVQKLLEDPNVATQMDLFHSFWMGYSELGGQTATSTDFRTETKALITKVLQENLPWSTVISSKQTYANGALAKLYDMDDQTTAAWKWRTYNGERRQGLISHGSFLSVGVKFGDTSTTRRGYNIQKALFCGHVGRPPTTDENGKPIDIDVPPPSNVVYECKADLYKNTVLARPNCAGCHSMMDKIAFGLENFAADASYRTTELGKPNCSIKGVGEANVMTQTGLTKLGEFSGPKQLADLVLSTGYIEKCMAQRMIEFSSGRKLGVAEEVLVNKVNALNKSSANFKTFLKSYLLSSEFSNRRGS